MWLPLPHVLNMLPVQIDALYRTGASAIAISVLGMAVAAWALASLILRTTGSIERRHRGAPLLLVAIPNVLYLQSTPMTEPLLFGDDGRWRSRSRPQWIDVAVRGAGRASAGVALAAACLTRYEAWPIAAALIAIAGAVVLRRGGTVRGCAPRRRRSRVGRRRPSLLFLINSRWTVGAWFVSGGFFVPENTEALGHPLVAWRAGTRGSLPPLRLGAGLAGVRGGRARHLRVRAVADRVPRWRWSSRWPARRRSPATPTCRAIRFAFATTCRWSPRAPR